MGFLDNIENNLKALEGREERDGGEHQSQRRETERRAALAAAPFAERLKSGPYTSELLQQAAVLGHGVRTKVQATWLGTTLRLEARGRKLDLRPTAEGVLAVFLDGTTELRSAPVDLEGSPEPLIREFLNEAAA